MRTYGRAASRVTQGTVIYTSSGAAQTAINAAIAADLIATYQIGASPTLYPVYPNATAAGNVLTYIANENTYHLTYSIRQVGANYFVDTSLSQVDGQVWVKVETTPAAGDTYVWLTTLVQNLKLSPGESPFFANNGIPAQPTIITQIFPDFYVAQIQQQFAPFFATLGVSKQNIPDPSYRLNIITKNGTVLNEVVAV